MTTRPGNAALDLLRYRRCKTLAHCIRLVRPDGFELLVTDHDRKITFEGRQYMPQLFGDLSADRREAGLRSGNQEARGPIDGATIVLPDLVANRYRGAEVSMAVIDWVRPWIAFARHTKYVRKVVWTGSQWVATLESRTQQLSRPSAGRFGGTFSVYCPYTVGDKSCKKDISFATQWGSANTNGTSTSCGYATLTDSGASWTVNQFAGQQLFTYAGLPGSGQQRRVVSNTSTKLTLDEAWDVQPSVVGYVIGNGPAVSVVVNNRSIVQFGTSDFYYGALIAEDGAYRDGSIQWTTGANVGAVSNIVRYEGANRLCELLIPTPFPIQVGDKGVVTVGCDGLFSTCRDKFENEENHGGDPYAPSAQAIIEPPEET